MKAIDKGLATGQVEGKRQWYLNRQGQTMVVVPNPGEFWMGAGADKHRRKIDRSFAIASKAVTVDQYLRFRKEHEFEKHSAPTGDCPVIRVSWYDAAAYCNWLSEQEGLLKDQWCYEVNDKGEYAAGMKMAPDYLQRTGYRLPREAEWEFSCRAGSKTAYSFGEPPDLLDRYGWFNKNSLVPSPVGLLKSNDLGLFDMHGNVWQWCQDAHENYPKGAGSDDDKERVVGKFTQRETRVLRGGSVLFQAPNVRSFTRIGWSPATYRNEGNGFRVGRTLALHPLDLKKEGAFGFRQDQATVLCDTELLRLSAWNDAAHLYVQAVLWTAAADSIGETDDGWPIGDRSNLSLDLDADGKATPNVDREYMLNPWPGLPGLRYSVVLGPNSTTGIKGDTKGRGAVRYLYAGGRKVRVDSYLIPLAEIGRKPSDKIRMAYWGSSEKPKLTLNSVGFEGKGSYYWHSLPREKYHQLTLADRPASVDVTAVPNGNGQADLRPTGDKPPADKEKLPARKPDVSVPLPKAKEKAIPDILAAKDKQVAEHLRAGRLDLAVPLLVDIVNGRKTSLGPDHPHTLASMGQLGVIYWQMRQLDKSVPLFVEVLKVREAKFGRDHPETQMTVANLGVNYKDAGRLKEAIPMLEEAHRAAKNHPTLRWVRTPLLDAYAKAGENAKLVKLVPEVLTEARKSLPKDSPQLAGQLSYMSQCLLQAKAFTEAVPLLRECLAIREKTQPDAWPTFYTKSSLGRALLGQKKYADAEPLLLAGYEGMKQRENTIPPQDKIRITEAIEMLVQLYKATDKKDEAAKWQKTLESPAGKVVGSIHEIGQGLELRGQLDKQTPTLVYQVKLTAGKTYVIDMVSPDQKALDPYLVLTDAAGKKLAEDDDSGGGLNARITFRAEQSGAYRIQAISFNGGVGAFTLTVREQAKPK